MPERVLLMDIKRADGTVAYPAGRTLDWPPATWNDVAAQVGVRLDELSQPTHVFANALLAQQRAQAASQPAVPPSAQPADAPTPRARGKRS